jgi:hypothetical protein
MQLFKDRSCKLGRLVTKLTTAEYVPEQVEEATLDMDIVPRALALCQHQLAGAR